MVNLTNIYFPQFLRAFLFPYALTRCQASGENHTTSQLDTKPSNPPKRPYRRFKPPFSLRNDAPSHIMFITLLVRLRAFLTRFLRLLPLPPFSSLPPPPSFPPSPPFLPSPKPVYALDCEMVGGARNANILARVSLSLLCPATGSWSTALDVHVRPTRRVVDYRTAYSGVKPEHLRSGTAGAPLVGFTDARSAVVSKVKGATLVVHDGRADFECLRYRHPGGDLRDTSLLPRFMWQGRRRR